MFEEKQGLARFSSLRHSQANMNQAQAHQCNCFLMLAPWLLSLGLRLCRALCGSSGPNVLLRHSLAINDTHQCQRSVQVLDILQAHSVQLYHCKRLTSYRLRVFNGMMTKGSHNGEYYYSSSCDGHSHPRAEANSSRCQTAGPILPELQQRRIRLFQTKAGTPLSLGHEHTGHRVRLVVCKCIPPSNILSRE